MKARVLLATALLVLLPLACFAGNVLLYDFENGTQDWGMDWGSKQPVALSTKCARHGKSSLMVEHKFVGKECTIGIRVSMTDAMNVTTNGDFTGLSAWLYLPRGDDWEAQLYVRTGDEWRWCAGKLLQKLEPGWHQVFIRPGEIDDVTRIHDIGIQVKNYKVNDVVQVFVDRVEASYTK